MMCGFPGPVDARDLVTGVLLVAVLLATALIIATSDGTGRDDPMSYAVGTK